MCRNGKTTGRLAIAISTLTAAALAFETAPAAVNPAPSSEVGSVPGFPGFEIAQDKTDCPLLDIACLLNLPAGTVPPGAIRRDEGDEGGPAGPGGGGTASSDDGDGGDGGGGGNTGGGNANAGRGNGSEGSPDSDPGNSGGNNKGGD